MGSPACLAVASCSHAICAGSMIACSGSILKEGRNARHLGVQLHSYNWSLHRKFDFQGGRIQRPTVSLPMSSKAPSIRAAKSDEAGAPRRTRAAKKSVGQSGAKEDTRPTAKVTFQLKHQIHFGQELCVVGSSSELGQWDIKGALPLTWTEGHVWKAEKAVGVGQTVECKFVITKSGGGVEWQPGENRVFETKNADDLMVSVPWNPSNEVSPDVLDDVPPEAVAGFDNGVAPGTDTIEGIVAAAEMVADSMEKSAGNVVPSATKTLIDATRKDGDAREAQEVPAVDAIVATAVAEISGTAEELATDSADIVEQPQAEEDDESGGSPLAQQEEGTGKSSQGTVPVTEVEELKGRSTEPLSSTKAIVDNDLQWISRTFGSKSKRTRR